MSSPRESETRGRRDSRRDKREEQGRKRTGISVECPGDVRYTTPSHQRTTPTTEGSPSWTWQAGGGSFLLLLRRHALHSPWLWTFTHNACEKPPGRSSFRNCYQFSLLATSLLGHMAESTALVCGAQCSMSVRLGYWQSQTYKVCRGMTGQWSDRSAMSRPKTLSPSGPISYFTQLCIEDLVLILKERRLCWYGHMECSNGAVKTACDIQADGKHGDGRLKMTWKQLTEWDGREWIFWLCWGLTTHQPLWVILCRFPEKGRKEIKK